MNVDFHNPEPRALQTATRIVHEGGIVLYPTDTIYGLGCDPFDEKAVERIFELKGRDPGKGVLLLIPDPTWTQRLASGIAPAAEKLMERLWPGPLTLLFDASPEVPPSLTGEGGKIGLRSPDVPFLHRWLDILQIPLVSTSANRSGEPYRGDPSQLRDLFGDDVDLFLDAGRLKSQAASTVVDVSVTPARLVREGALSQAVEKVLT